MAKYDCAFNSEDLDDITVPYSKEFDPDNGEDFPQPCTGNGFTGSDKYMIPEYRLDSYYSPTAAVIYRLDKNGHETPVAIFHGQKFELI